MRSDYRLIYFVPDIRLGTRVPIGALVRTDGVVRVVRAPAQPHPACRPDEVDLYRLVRDLLVDVDSFDALPRSTNMLATLGPPAPVADDDAVAWVQRSLFPVRLWLDDLRPAPHGWTHARTAPEAIALLAAGGVEEVSLDHDLGPPEAGTGYDVAAWIEARAAEGTLPRVSWRVHSANPVGVQRIRAALESAERWWRGGA